MEGAPTKKKAPNTTWMLDAFRRGKKLRQLRSFLIHCRIGIAGSSRELASTRPTSTTIIASKVR